jgi:group I intron endonuclease
MIGIYKITSPSGRIYIGQSINLQERLRKYKELNRSKSQPKLNRSFKKYGISNHIFEIEIKCELEQLNTLERFYQEQYNCCEVGLNCMLTKTSDRSGEHSEETKLKCSLSQRGDKSAWWGKSHTEETKFKMKNWHKNNSHPLLGKQGKDCVNSKVVLNTANGIFYDSCKEASIASGFKYSTLRSMLNGSKENKSTLLYI